VNFHFSLLEVFKFKVGSEVVYVSASKDRLEVTIL